MKRIVHVALCGPVTDNFSYQDNLLPKYHKKNGYEVSMITSKYIYDNNGELTRDHRKEYLNEYGIKTIRLDTKYLANMHSKFKRYKRLYETIEQEKPDILFIHGVQFLDVSEIVNYIKKNPDVLVFVDNHADYSNSSTNWISKNILHKIIWKKYAQMIEPYTNQFYGVLPARVDFLIDMYDLPKEKVDFLVMGADDDEILRVQESNSRFEIREKYNIQEDDFLIVTGGKIDLAKSETLLLMEAVKKLDTNIKLLVFGSVVSELKEDFSKLIDDKKIQYAGWIQSNESYDYFEAADLVVFPGRHSVFWEQIVAQGKPMIVKYWEGTTHIDIGGNVKFLSEGTVTEMVEIIDKVVNNKQIYNKMKSAANTEEKKSFLYSEIAKKSIQ